MSGVIIDPGTAHELTITYGASLISTFFSLFCLGILITSALQYFHRFPQDKLLYRVLVVSMVTLAATSASINAASLYNGLVTNFGDITQLYTVNWETSCLIPFIAGTCLLLQSFLCWRIYIVSSRTWVLLPAVSLAATLAGFGISIYIGAWMGTQTFTGVIDEMGKFIWAWFGCHALAELLSTGSLVWWLILRPRKQHGELTQTSAILRKLALRAVETNVLSLTWQILVVVLYSQNGEIGYWYNFAGTSITSVYAFSLLVSLLSRTDEHSSFCAHSSSLGPSFVGKSNPILGQHPNAHAGVSVQVHHLTTIDAPERTRAVYFEDGIEDEKPIELRPL